MNGMRVGISRLLLTATGRECERGHDVWLALDTKEDSDLA